MSNFVETWKGIATALGRSERWCRYMARRAGDPLPVFKVGGIVRLNSGDLEDWLARQRERSIRTPIRAADGRGRHRPALDCLTCGMIQRAAMSRPLSRVCAVRSARCSPTSMAR